MAISATLLALLPASIAHAQETPKPAGYAPWSASGPGTPALYSQPRPAALSGTPAARQTAYQPANPPLYGQPGGPTDETAQELQIPLEPPGPDRIHRLESEAHLMERMRQEARNRRPMERIAFPDEPVLSKETYAGRMWPQQDKCVEPNYVCYERLLFEQKNMERYGWDLGPISPFLATGGFFLHMAAVPYNKFKDPFRCQECSAGYCLPGDPVPYLLYPPEASATGALAETAAVLAILAIFP